MSDMKKRYGLLALGLIATLLLLALAFLDRPDLRLEETLTTQVRLSQLAAGMRVDLRKNLEAEKNALLSSSREQAASYAQEATASAKRVEQARAVLDAALRKDSSGPLLERLEDFNRGWSELSSIDKEFLPLVVQKTNTLASMLSYSEGVLALDRLEASLGKAVGLQGGKDTGTSLACLTVLAEAARILALQGPHIAEASDARMTEIEAAMNAGAAKARQALQGAGQGASPELANALAQARADLEAFLAVNARVLELSRINSDVKSLALSMQRKQNAAAACETALAAIQTQLDERLSKATR
ncbi:hypothetical protein NNJEOMEG_03496 [Fundidesulfovibrio magnetotacticus]|uniref:Methyl-accepting chemotaxis protein n=1 Tax=Fundidesulfovibrio magnetotacticus TaxID=2730080 RepID=A0A6V8LZH8_9BACT|nr:hypothetical protein [Fundidesulfovibrio magnetotacticus]GFK95628.1 hypothetical protein NNJEOMEG_03496 [Fundidesulfovibrio magnetotacticus]